MHANNFSSPLSQSPISSSNIPSFTTTSQSHSLLQPPSIPPSSRSPNTTPPGSRRSSGFTSSLKSAMLKFWPSSPLDQLTPKAAPDGRERNPFDALPAQAISSETTNTSNSQLSASNPSAVPPRSPTAYTFQAHHLLNTHSRSGSLAGDQTPLAAGIAPPVQSAGAGPFAAAIPTQSTPFALSLHVPDKMSIQSNTTNLSSSNNAPASSPQAAPSTRPNLSSAISFQKSAHSNAPSLSNTSSSSSTASPSYVSRGQIHVKIIQARGLNVHSLQARPYVIVQFEQNEFISRDPIHEQEKEARGVATVLSRVSSSTALGALGAINSRAIEAAKRSAANSAASSPQSSVSSGRSTKESSTNGSSTTSTTTAPTSSGFLTPSTVSNGGGLFGSMPAHNPVWKHEVSLSVFFHPSCPHLNEYKLYIYIYDFSMR